MNKCLRNFLKCLALPVLNRYRKQKYGFLGNYRNWSEALAASTSYNSDVILNKVTQSMLKVKNGLAAYERDSVLFEEIHYSWPLLSGLMWIATQSHGNLNVIDFGGSLGSTYFQNRKFLETISFVRWNVVEQPNFVETGKRYFEDEKLKFYLDIETCFKETSANTVILSGVLPYIEKPYNLLEKTLKKPIEYVIIDRTPITKETKDVLHVQRIHPSIFSASYPAWILSERCLKLVLDQHEIIEEFNSFEGEVLYGYNFKGFIIKVR